jgi:hypothetical protein
VSQGVIRMEPGDTQVFASYDAVQKTNSRTYNFFEVSGHNLESSQT